MWQLVGANLVFALFPLLGTKGEHKVRPYAPRLKTIQVRSPWRVKPEFQKFAHSPPPNDMMAPLHRGVRDVLF